MTLTDALQAAQDAAVVYQNAATTYVGLVTNGSPQPMTNNALAVAGAALTALKATQAAVDAAYSAL